MNYNINVIKFVWRQLRKPNRVALDAIMDVDDGVGLRSALEGETGVSPANFQTAAARFVKRLSPSSTRPTPVRATNLGYQY